MTDIYNEVVGQCTPLSYRPSNTQCHKMMVLAAQKAVDGLPIPPTNQELTDKISTLNERIRLKDLYIQRLQQESRNYNP